MEKIYNVQQHSYLKQIDLGTVALDYSRHAIQRCSEKRIKLFSAVLVKGNVVELEKEERTGRVTKLVVRIQYNNQNDAVLVLIPSTNIHLGKLLVKTVWLNKITDNHQTLNKARLA